MKKRVVTIMATLLLSVLTRGHTQEPDAIKDNAKAFMRAKLTQSQRALEGLTTEDFDKIAKASQEMSLLSQANQWQVLQTTDYVRRSAEFRRELDALTNAARKKNLDGATLAYLKVTINCIECHKYVRSIRQARTDTPTSRAGVPGFKR